MKTISIQVPDDFKVPEGYEVKRTIKKLIGRDMTWEDEPFNMNK